eukprot:GEZU01021599.1.p1 GENE.GEZU01021599.1~~GEZU01021599.1.p1  ORF type:complete len:100 (+),score=11.99 GEZU01021599.1:660-959(+)
MEARTFTINIGSAHSKFEFHLPGGHELKLRYLVPMGNDEFTTFVPNKQSPFHMEFPLDGVSVNDLIALTGKLPLEVAIFKSIRNKELFIATVVRRSQSV